MRFDRPTTLPSGLRVRFRLPQAADRPALRELLARDGDPVDDVRAGRLLRFDPRNRLVLCAAAPVGGREALVAVGTITPDREARPVVLVADERAAPGVGDALAERLLAHARERAAA